MRSLFGLDKRLYPECNVKHGSLYAERGCAHSSFWMEEDPKAARGEGGEPATCQVRSGKKPCSLIEGQEVKITDVERLERAFGGKHQQTLGVNCIWYCKPPREQKL